MNIEIKFESKTFVILETIDELSRRPSIESLAEEDFVCVNTNDGKKRVRLLRR